MPTFQVKILEAKKRYNSETVIFTAQLGNKIITRTITRDSFATWEDFCRWIIEQEPDFILLPDKLKTLDITFHTEIVNSPEVGDVEVNVFDSVVVS